VTSGPAPSSPHIVVGVDVDGTEVARLELRHGDDPTRLLGLQGWDVRRVRDVIRHPAQSQVLTMTFLVEPSVSGRLADVGDPLNPLNLVNLVDQVDLVDQVAAEGEVPVRHQRVAAYALVTSSRGLLMTQFSDQTNAQGQWGLPGGGLEVEEAPERAVVREVWEESGQAIRVSDIALVRTSRWVGRAPSGQLEDFHAVRVVYHGVCPEPTDPVVHDVGGTTASAAWLHPADVADLALTSGWRSILQDVAALQ
jgi:8-oxo-dGTP diphosphatase